MYKYSTYTNINTIKAITTRENHNFFSEMYPIVGEKIQVSKMFKGQKEGHLH